MKGLWTFLLIIVVIQAFTGVFTNEDSRLGQRVQGAWNGFNEPVEAKMVEHPEAQELGQAQEDGIVEKFEDTRLFLTDGRELEIGPCSDISIRQANAPAGTRVHVFINETQTIALRHTDHLNLANCGAKNEDN